MTFKEVPESEPVEEEAQEEDAQDQSAAGKEVCYQTAKGDMQTHQNVRASWISCV